MKGGKNPQVGSVQAGREVLKTNPDETKRGPSPHMGEIRSLTFIA